MIEPFGDDWLGDLPTNVRQLKRVDVAVSDIFASVDVVVTKPGFGVLSDCRVNGKPIVWVDRVGFRETPVLVKALREGFWQVEVPAADLYAGRIGEAIADVLVAEPVNVEVDADVDRGRGAGRVAELILGGIGR